MILFLLFILLSIKLNILSDFKYPDTLISRSIKHASALPLYCQNTAFGLLIFSFAFLYALYFWNADFMHAFLQVDFYDIETFLTQDGAEGIIDFINQNR